MRLVVRIPQLYLWLVNLLIIMFEVVELFLCIPHTKLSAWIGQMWQRWDSLQSWMAPEPLYTRQKERKTEKEVLSLVLRCHFSSFLEVGWAESLLFSYTKLVALKNRGWNLRGIEMDHLYCWGLGKKVGDVRTLKILKRRRNMSEVKRTFDLFWSLITS